MKFTVLNLTNRRVDAAILIQNLNKIDTLEILNVDAKINEPNDHVLYVTDNNNYNRGDIVAPNTWFHVGEVEGYVIESDMSNRTCPDDDIMMIRNVSSRSINVTISIKNPPKKWIEVINCKPINTISEIPHDDCIYVADPKIARAAKSINIPNTIGVSGYVNRRDVYVASHRSTRW